MTRVFTYGTLRPSLYPDRRHPLAGPAAAATLTGHFTMLNLGRYPALCESDDEHTIVGEVFEIDTVERFDRYEGYMPDGRGLYDRQQVKVRGLDGTVYLAWVYFMHKEKADDLALWGRIVASGDWADAMPEDARRR